MAICYFAITTIGRATGGSPVRSAAYRHAQKVTNELTGETKNYSGKAHEVVHEEMILPANAPEWARDRYLDCPPAEASNRLWHDIERRELSNRRGAKAQYAQSFTIALPRELSRDQQIVLLREYVSQNFTRNGEIADVVIHDKLDGNPHAHVMTTMRYLGEEGFGNRINTYASRRNDIVNLRYAWAVCANAALEAAGIEARIDHRKMVDQGIELNAISYSPYVEEAVEAAGETYRIKERVAAGLVANDAYLRENPEHILLVVARDVGPLFTLEDVRAQLTRYVPPSVGRDEIDAMVDRVRAGSEMVVTTAKGARGQTLYTTRAALEMGRNLEASVLSLASGELDLGAIGGEVAGDVPGAELLSDRLSAEQRRAAEAMISARRIAVVNGFAGAGKTFTMVEASKVWRARGVQVLGAAVSGRAVQELTRLEGVSATVAQWEARWDRGELPRQGGFVLFLDEAGMMGTVDMSRFLGRVDALGGKVVLVGAREQLGPIQDTAAFSHVASLAGAVTLEEVRRQAVEVEAQAVAAFSRGGAETAVAIDMFAARGVFRFEESQARAIAQIAEHYFEGDAGPAGRLALAHRNVEVDALNAAIRKEAVKRGLVDAKRSLSLPVRGRADGGREIEIAVGDGVRFTRGYGAEDITKSSFAHVLGISGDHLILRVDGRNGVVEVDTKDFAHFDYGYAATVHKSQGMTVKGTVDVLINPMFDWHLMDVAFSRHVEGLRVWAGRDEVADLNQIKVQARRSSLIDVAVGPRGGALRRAHDHVDYLALGKGRLDRVVDIAPQVAVERVGFTGDAHLVGIARRMSGLLAGEWQLGMAAVVDDVRGYASDPLRAVDDLIGARGVLRASDVAGRLSEVIKEPDMFNRAFAQAMSHPDLVILSDEGLYGEGRVYTTRGAVARDLAVMDRAVMLARGDEAARALGLARGAQYAAVFRDGNELFEPWRDRLRGAVAEPRILIAEARGLDGIEAGFSRYRTLSYLADQKIAEDAGVDARPGTPYVAHPRGDVAALVGRAIAYDAKSLADLGAAIREGSVELGPQDHVLIPEADGLDAAGWQAVFDFADATGVKLVLHHDPHREDGSGLLRQMKARLGSVSFDLDEPPALCGALETAVGMSVSEQGGPQMDLFGGDHPSDRGSDMSGQLRAVFDQYWHRDVIGGAQDEAAQKRRFADRVLAEIDAKRDYVAVVRTSALRDELNQMIENRLHGSMGELVVAREGGAGEQRFSVGSHVILRRDLDMPDLGWRGLPKDTRGVIVGIDLDAGEVQLECGYKSPVTIAARDFEALDYGYVARIDAARRRAVGVQRKGSEASLLIMADRHMGRGDLLAAAHMGDVTHLSLPVDVQAQGVGIQYLEGVLTRDRARGVLDYGFDVARAAEAAEAALASASDIAALERLEPLSGDERAVVARLRGQYRENPLMVAAELSREKGRFDLGQFAAALDALGGDAQDVQGGSDAQAVLTGLVAEGYVIEVGRGADGDAVKPLYVSRDRALLEREAYDLGARLIASGGLELRDARDVSARADMRVVDAGLAGRTGLVIATGVSLRDAQALEAQYREAGVEVGEVLTLSALERMFARGGFEGARLEIAVAAPEKLGAGQWGRLLARADAQGARVIVELGEGSGAGPVHGISLLAAWRGDMQRDGEVVERGLERLRNRDLALQSDTMGALAAGVIREYWEGQAATRDSGVWVPHVVLAGSRAEADRFDAELRRAGEARGLLQAATVLQDKYGTAVPVSVGQVFAAQADIAGLAARGDAVRVAGVEGGQLVLENLRAEVTKVDVDHPGVALRMAETLYTGRGLAADRYDLIAGYGMGHQGLGAFLDAAEDRGARVALHYARDRFSGYGRLEAALTRANAHGFAVEGVDAARAVSVIGRYLDVAALAGRDAPVVQALPFGDDPHLADVAERFVARLRGARANEDGTALRILGDDPRAFEVAADPARVVDELLAARSVFKAEDVARELSRHILEPRAFVSAFAEAMRAEGLVQLSADDGAGGGAVYTRVAHIEREAGLVARAEALARMKSGFAPSAEQVAVAIARPSHGLSLDQVAAVEDLCRGARFALMVGPAGTGKSSVMAVVKDLYQEERWQVMGCALSAKAARGFEEASGIKSASIAALLTRARSGRLALDAHSVLVVDEAGMVDARDWDQLIGLVERAGATLIATGDADQLAPRGPGAMLRVFEARIGAAELSTVWRQRHPMDAKASLDLARGEKGSERALAHFEARGFFVGVDEGLAPAQRRAAQFARVVEGYLSDPHQEKSIIAYTRADVAELNALVRARLHGARLAQSETGSVPSVMVESGDGAALEVAVGDLIAFGQNDYRRGVFNGEVGEVMAVDAAKGIYIAKLGTGDEARHVSLPVEGGPMVSYGYARTVHASQGVSEQSTHYAMSDADHQRIFYVAASRYKEQLRIYAPVAEGEVKDYAAAICDKRFDEASLVREAHGFMRAPNQNTEVTDVAPEALTSFWQQHMGDVSPAPMSAFERVFGARSSSGGDLGQGAARLAARDMAMGHMAEVGALPSVKMQEDAAKLLSEVSDGAAWAEISARLPRQMRERIDGEARRVTNVSIEAGLLPEARALARGLAVARFSENYALADVLEKGLAFTAARAQAGKDYGVYKMLIAEAYGPDFVAEARKGLRADLARAQMEERERPMMGSGRGVFNAFKYPGISAEQLGEITAKEMLMTVPDLVSDVLRGVIRAQYEKNTQTGDALLATREAGYAQAIQAYIEDGLKAREDAVVPQGGDVAPVSAPVSEPAANSEVVREARGAATASAARATPALAPEMDATPQAAVAQVAAGDGGKLDAPEAAPAIKRDANGRILEESMDLTPIHEGAGLYFARSIERPSTAARLSADERSLLNEFTDSALSAEDDFSYDLLLLRTSGIRNKSLFLDVPDKNVPQAWIDRQEQRARFMGDRSRSPGFKSREEFEWAVNHMIEYNIAEPIHGVASESQRDMVERLFDDALTERNFSDTRSGTLNYETSKWRHQLSEYTHHKFNVPRERQIENFRSSLDQYDILVRPIVEKEAVPADWKQRLEKRATGVVAKEEVTPKSVGEFMWVMKVLTQAPEVARLGRAPKSSDVEPRSYLYPSPRSQEKDLGPDLDPF